MSVGETKKTRIAPTDAYGEVDPGRVLKFPSSQAPKGLEPGMKVQLSNGMVATCTKLDDKEVRHHGCHDACNTALL